MLKYGGHAMTDPALQRAFAEDVVFLRYVGLEPVVVHGGGPQITAHLDRLGIPTEFRAGLRVTTPEAMEVVRMVLVGQVNGDVVRLVNDHGPFAVGLSGEDGGLMTAEPRTLVVEGEEVDLGLVGDVVAVDPGALRALLDDGRIPVVATVAARPRRPVVQRQRRHRGRRDRRRRCRRQKLVVLTDVEGLYSSWSPDGASGEVVSEITAADLAALLPTLSAGMVPKMEACLRAVRGGVPQAHVLDGRVPHAVLLEVFTDSGVGTMVLPDAAGGRRCGRCRMTAADALRARWDAVMMPNYGTPPVAIARGEGCRVWDVDGVGYLDCIAGIAVSALGHAHPALVEAVSRQVGCARPLQQPVRARARCRAGRAAGRPARRRRAGCSSATTAPRPTRRR